ncbi:FG-GAP-like repeat-containing protein [uncultured Paraglaciecola sp.]|uniref:VCBS repeat-containing protein n=1 Tax=uncultured Paraglaciecola sp. TaxID=1765024 RepID=UPI00259251DF|nr:FG-GAP-like repeat-containing protein [uncultured Paraglaciecola sp.]
MHTRVLSWLTICLLSACGGGSGNLSSTPPNSSAKNLYQGLTSKADVNETSAGVFVDTLFQGFISTGLDATDSEGESSVVDDKLVGGCGGSATFEDNRTTNSYLGTLSLDFDNFDDCSGTILDGEMVLDILEWDYSRSDIKNGTIEFDNTHIIDPESDLTMTGTFSFEYDSEQIVEIYTTESFEITNNQNSTQYWYVDYVEKLKYDNAQTLDNVTAINFSGRLFISEYGYMDISSNVDFLCAEFSAFNPSGCDINYENLGKITLTGNQGSIDFSFVAHSNSDYSKILKIEIDNNNDDTIDLELIENLSPNGTSLSPFAYAGSDQEKLIDETQEALLSATKSFDGDGDTLTYNWSINSNLSHQCNFLVGFKGDKSNVSIQETTSSETLITVSDYGDYCFEVEVFDQDGNSSEDTLLVRFNKLDLFSSSSQETIVDGNHVRLSSMSYVDLDNDGSEELFLHHHTGERAYFFKKNANNEYSHFQTVKLDFSLIIDRYTFADINSDGIKDWVVFEGQGTYTNINHYPILEDGTFGDPITIKQLEHSEGIYSLSLPVVFDFNNDGLKDILFRNKYLDNSLLISIQTENGFSDVIQYNNGNNIELSTVADFDGDTIIDIAALFVDRAVNVINVEILAFEDGEFVNKEEFSSSIDCGGYSCVFNNFSIKDIDGDGNGEVFIFTKTHLYIYKQSEQGFEESVLALSTIGQRTGSYYNYETLTNKPARFLDFNNDGRLDILGNTSFDYSLLLLQTEQGTFDESIRIPFVSQDALITDLNDDAIPDIVSATAQQLLIRTGKNLNR